jgi:hypothetical protein
MIPGRTTNTDATRAAPATCGWFGLARTNSYVDASEELAGVLVGAGRIYFFSVLM